MIEINIFKILKNSNQMIDYNNNNNNIVYSYLHQKYQFQYLVEKNLLIDCYRIQIIFNHKPVLNEYISVRESNGSIIVDKFGYKIPKPLLNSELSIKNRKKILDKYILDLKSLIENYSNAKILFSSDYFKKNDDILEKYWFNKLHINCNFNGVEFMSVVELNNSFDEIKKSFRRRYRSFIDENKYGIRLKFINKDNIKKKDIDTLRKFHALVSGRVTRSKYTWQIQYEMIMSGTAYVICAFQQNDTDLVSFSIIEINDNESMYSVGVYDRSLRTIPLGHIALANAIKYSKKMGCNKFILGEFLGSSGGFTEKEKSISHFKNGFSSFNDVELIFGCQG